MPEGVRLGVMDTEGGGRRKGSAEGVRLGVKAEGVRLGVMDIARKFPKGASGRGRYAPSVPSLDLLPASRESAKCLRIMRRGWRNGLRKSACQSVISQF